MGGSTRPGPCGWRPNPTRAWRRSTCLCAASSSRPRAAATARHGWARHGSDGRLHLAVRRRPAPDARAHRRPLGLLAARRADAGHPRPASEEGRRARSGTELVWVGGSDAVQVESALTPVRGLQMTLIEPGGEPALAVPRTAHRSPSRAGLRGRTCAAARRGAPTRGCAADVRATTGPIQQVHVHHTVNSNDYTRADVPGLIRGMYRYHTKNLGWSDIGYNFLVDRFGRAWVGRAGGPAGRSGAPTPSGSTRRRPGSP